MRLRNMRIAVKERYDKALYMDVMQQFQKGMYESATNYMDVYLPRTEEYTKRKVINQLVRLGGERIKMSGKLFITFNDEEQDKMEAAAEWINGFRLMDELVR